VQNGRAVAYRWALQAQAADELASLPHGATIGEMLNQYSIMREWVRVFYR
jgi:hypothetical protein